MRFFAPRTALTLLGTIICLSAPALADYQYASDTGSNQYPNTSWETATGSANARADAAGPRDAVCIANGEIVTGEPRGPNLSKKSLLFCKMQV
jgi:hypothetical protein